MISKSKKAKKEPKSFFGHSIKKYPAAHKLSIQLGMVGINTDIRACELILRAQAAGEKMGDNFDVKTASKISVDIDNEFTDLENLVNSKKQIKNNASSAA